MKNIVINNEKSLILDLEIWYSLFIQRLYRFPGFVKGKVGEDYVDFYDGEIKDTTYTYCMYRPKNVHRVRLPKNIKIKEANTNELEIIISIPKKIHENCGSNEKFQKEFTDYVQSRVPLHDYGDLVWPDHGINDTYTYYYPCDIESAPPVRDYRKTITKIITIFEFENE